MTQKVMLIGHFGGNAEIVPVGDEREVAKFSLATKELFQGRDPHTEWHNVNVYGKKGSFDKLLAAGKLNAGVKATLLDGVLRTRVSEKDGKKAYFYSVEFQLNPNTTMFELPANRSAQGAGQGQAAGQGQGQAAGQGQPTGQEQAAGHVAQQEPSALELARAKAAQKAQEAQAEIERLEREEQERIAREEQLRQEQARQVQQPQSAPPVYSEPPLDMDDDIPFAPLHLQYPQILYAM
ncbi:single-stranded DNA-binding protein [Aeromonas media]|uniref:single-stranded DNA-binding protein n=1 Tax=Aeromonas media TaxID=651 RepID=UPI003D243387